jgi:hypothetical protein
VIKQIQKKTVLDFFDTIFLQNVLCSVFELPLLRNTRKYDKTIKVEEKLTSKFLSIFPGKVFDMEKYLYGVFGLPLPRNVKKNIFGVGWFLES